jgi:hypothetical protein
VKRLIRYSAAGLAQMGTVCCPNCFGQAMPQLPLSGKNWSEHEHAKIGRLEAVCSLTTGAWTAITRTQATPGASSTTISITGSSCTSRASSAGAS